MSMNVWVKNGRVFNLFNETTGGTSVAASTRIYKDSPKATFQAVGTTTAGAGAATIQIQGSNIDDVNAYVTLGTISLTLGTTLVADGFSTDAAWKFVRANITAISGTGASVNVYMGV